MIKWSFAAQDDINHIWDYLEQKNEQEQANKIINAIIKSVIRLEQFPFSGRLRENSEIREIIVNGYPYILPYILQKSDVIILRVFHTRNSCKNL